MYLFVSVSTQLVHKRSNFSNWISRQSFIVSWKTDKRDVVLSYIYVLWDWKTDICGSVFMTFNNQVSSNFPQCLQNVSSLFRISVDSGWLLAVSLSIHLSICSSFPLSSLHFCPFLLRTRWLISSSNHDGTAFSRCQLFWSNLIKRQEKGFCS